MQIQTVEEAVEAVEVYGVDIVVAQVLHGVSQKPVALLNGIFYRDVRRGDTVAPSMLPLFAYYLK